MDSYGSICFTALLIYQRRLYRKRIKQKNYLVKNLKADICLVEFINPYRISYDPVITFKQTIFREVLALLPLLNNCKIIVFFYLYNLLIK